MNCLTYKDGLFTGNMPSQAARPAAPMVAEVVDAASASEAAEVLLPLRDSEGV